MAKEKVCGIYCIENLIDGKKYIGQSCNIYCRWAEHLGELKNNHHHNSCLQNAWNKYGEENFEFKILEKCNLDILNEKEIYYIEKYNTFKHSINSKGYNLTTGGHGIGKISDEMREIFRKAQKTKPIYQIDLCGNIINKWSGSREASKKLKIEQSCIWNCVNKKRLTYKKSIWVLQEEYHKNFDINNYINQNTQPKNVYQFDLYGNLIKIWESTYQTISENYDPSSVAKACKSNKHNYKDYLWSYEDKISDFTIKENHKHDYIHIFFNDIYIDTAKSQMEICNNYKLPTSYVSIGLNKKIKVKGYFFEYSSNTYIDT